jgi:steroid delta-isomerase-like uncharacterized protein
VDGIQRLLDKRPQEVRMSTANKELSRRFTELFSTGDEALADEVLAPDVVFHGTTGDGELRGIDAMKAFLAGYRRAFPDARSTVEEQVAEADTVVTRWRARGTHRGELGPIPPTGRDFEMEGVTIERIAAGKIAEVWVARDELGLLRQLGLLPAPDAAGV